MNNQPHPFHLVDPSPPIVTATAAFGTTTGGVMYFHNYIGGNFLMSLSLSFLVFMMFTYGDVFVKVFEGPYKS
jgi:hypothetical protein